MAEIDVKFMKGNRQTAKGMGFRWTAPKTGAKKKTVARGKKK